MKSPVTSLVFSSYARLHHLFPRTFDTLKLLLKNSVSLLKSLCILSLSNPLCLYYLRFSAIITHVLSLVTPRSHTLVSAREDQGVVTEVRGCSSFSPRGWIRWERGIIHWRSEIKETRKEWHTASKDRPMASGVSLIYTSPITLLLPCLFMVHLISAAFITGTIIKWIRSVHTYCLWYPLIEWLQDRNNPDSKDMEMIWSHLTLSISSSLRLYLRLPLRSLYLPYPFYWHFFWYILYNLPFISYCLYITLASRWHISKRWPLIW